MTNHLHMIVDTSGTASIGDVLRDFKKFTSKGIVKAIQENEQESRQDWLLNRFRFQAANDKKITNFKFWQDDNYVENIVSYDFYRQKLNYIHENPVRQVVKSFCRLAYYGKTNKYIFKIYIFCEKYQFIIYIFIYLQPILNMDCYGN